MNILAIASYTFLPAQMGGQKHIELFYRYVGAAVNTIVVSTQANEEAFARNFTLVKLFDNRQSRYANPVYFFKLKKLIRAHGITHLIIEHPYMGWLAVALQKATGVKLFVHSHNIESERFKSLHKKWWKLLWHYEKWVHRNADHSFFITEEDLQYAVEHFGLRRQQCSTAFYGIETAEAPAPEQKRLAKKTICNALQLSLTNSLLFFNGNFFYKPNRDALFVLLNTIVPLLNKAHYHFTLIVCGKGMDEELKKIKPAHVLLLDFVPDIVAYNLAADVFLNPVTEGGGVKTKMIEALAANTTVVSARSGAGGVKKEWCGSKLTIVEDKDWIAFADAIKANATNDAPVAEIFFQKFYMGNIVKAVIQALQTLTL